LLDMPAAGVDQSNATLDWSDLLDMPAAGVDQSSATLDWNDPTDLSAAGPPVQAEPPLAIEFNALLNLNDPLFNAWEHSSESSDSEETAVPSQSNGLDLEELEVESLARFAQAMGPVVDRDCFMELARAWGAHLRPGIVRGLYNAFSSGTRDVGEAGVSQDDPIVIE